VAEGAAKLRPEQGWRRPIITAIGFGLIALFVMAGALGMAIGVMFVTLFAMPRWREIQALFPLELAHSVFLMFVAWVWLSTLWSPYTHTTQAIYLVLGAFIYPFFVYTVASLRGKARRIVIMAALFSGIAMLLPYLLEATTGVISRFYEAGWSRENMLRDGTRGVAAIIMATPALGALWVLRFSGRNGKIGAGILVVLVVFISWRFHLFAGLLALLVGGGAFAAGWRWPRTTVLLVTLGFLTSILLAPMMLPVIAAPLDNVDLPFSWAWRVKMWPYTGEQINLHPLIGWGLDASRTFTDDHFEMRGFSLRYLVQHPHNLGLQVWLETGLVGAFLLSIATALFGIRLSIIRHLSPMQAGAICGSAAVYLVFFMVTYGAWQEWLWASIAWVSALCALAGPPSSKGQTP
jgi:O-antigen ligase